MLKNSLRIGVGDQHRAGPIALSVSAWTSFDQDNAGIRRGLMPRLRPPASRPYFGRVILYLAHGYDPLGRAYYALLVLAHDEAEARGIIAHEVRASVLTT